MGRIGVVSLVLSLCLAGCAQESADLQDSESQADIPELAPSSNLASDDDEIGAWLRDYYDGASDLRYRSAEVDLDGDGTAEILVYARGRGVCGSGGCRLFELQRAGTGLELRGKQTIAQLPIGVFESSTDGWRDLAVSVFGGGIREAYVARIPFADGQYALNPSVAPAQPSEEAYETLFIQERW